MKTMQHFLICLGTWICTSSLVHAGLIVDFYSSGVSQHSFTLGLGDQVTIDVFLVQTNGTTLITDEGLQFAGISLQHGAGSSAQVLSTLDVSPNLNFDDFADVTLQATGVDLDAGSLNPFFPSIVSPDRILLGSYTLTAISSGTTTLSFADLNPNPGVDNFLTGLGTAFDSQIDFSTTASIDVAAVPEPSSILACLVFGGAAWLRHRRRRSQLVAEPDC